jgi:hypothetical protein
MIRPNSFDFSFAKQLLLQSDDCILIVVLLRTFSDACFARNFYTSGKVKSDTNQSIIDLPSDFVCFSSGKFGDLLNISGS